MLIYIAGLDGTGELFFKQAPRLARTYRVVTFRSREGSNFGYDELTSDIAQIAGELGETRATIVGESFGGTVALKFALRYPAMVERLVIVNSFPRFRGRKRIRLANLLAAAAPTGLIRPLRVAANLLGLYIDGVTKEDRRRFFEAMRSVERESYRRRLQLISELDIEESLALIESPVLFVAARRDIVVPSEREARSMALRIPNAKVVLVEGAGHACLLGSRVNLAEILENWNPVRGGA